MDVVYGTIKAPSNSAVFFVPGPLMHLTRKMLSSSKDALLISLHGQRGRFRSPCRCRMVALLFTDLLDSLYLKGFHVTAKRIRQNFLHKKVGCGMPSHTIRRGYLRYRISISACRTA